MRKDEFIKRFNKAAEFCYEFSQSLIVEKLPSELLFNFARAKVKNENEMIKYLGGRILKPKEMMNIQAIKARKYLWANGKIPVWINIRFDKIDENFTYLEIATSDKLTEDESKFYHKEEGLPPFHILGPSVPWGWESVKKDGKISLR